MKHAIGNYLTFLLAPTLIVLAACGVETASTAATGAAIKKQELEQGRAAMERAEEKIGEATARMQERAGAADR